LGPQLLSTTQVTHISRIPLSLPCLRDFFVSRCAPKYSTRIFPSSSKRKTLSLPMCPLVSLCASSTVFLEAVSQERGPSVCVLDLCIGRIFTCQYRLRVAAPLSGISIQCAAAFYPVRSARGALGDSLRSTSILA
ncbi:hypothetical protein B0H10DRAFT_2078714, partial [Mycena sp. CBHHK59/15]